MSDSGQPTEMQPTEMQPPEMQPPDMQPPEEMQAAPGARTAADGYAFAAIVCAAAGLLLPIGISLIGGKRGFLAFALVLISAPASLMLARATEEDVAGEAVNPSVARVAGIAQTLAYASLALVVTFCAALLLGILGRVVT